MEKKFHLEVLPKQEREVFQKIAPVVNPHGLVLAGGTAAALHMGHRISRDFDFFAPQSFSAEKLIQNLKTLGLKMDIEFQRGESDLIAFLDGVKFSAFHYPYPFLKPTDSVMKITMANLLDIAAMKILAIGQRGAKRDFVDLYFILKKFSCSQIGQAFSERYGKERLNPVFVGKSLIYFADAEGDGEPEYCSQAKPSWPSIKKFFQAHARQFVLDFEAAANEE
ncbi:MAG: nucleotidyl transferase AbiEii/AbiGii toxin family protein [Elusimicrobia bacterium]|nr:nucleotidyl transferase AbiEii/AbiGii toxin family protein [Elusimicrobiota bacterium]